METAKKVLDTMVKIGEPTNASTIVKESGLEKADVDKAMKELKAEGKIVSPVRCKWEPAK